MGTRPLPGSLAEVETPQTYRALIRSKLVEWGPLDKRVAIDRLTVLMPPGYAWRIYQMERKGKWKMDDLDDVIPEPETREDIDRAQRALVLWLLRQLRREHMLIEENGMLAFNHRR